MRDLCSLIWCAVVGLVRSRVALQAEILALRHQFNVLRRKSPKRMALGNIDHVLLIGLYRLAPNSSRPDEKLPQTSSAKCSASI